MRAILWQDFETGGVNPWQHSPLSFAMIATRGREIIGEWYTQIRQPPFEVTDEAMQINKLDLNEPGLTFRDFNIEYMTRVNDWFYGGTNHNVARGTFLPGNVRANKDNMPKYGGHNTFFDRQVLQRILGASLFKEKFDGCYYHRVDTMVLASALQEVGLIPPGPLKLEILCNYLGIKAEGEFHNALTDLRMTVKCYFAMCDLIAGPKMIHPDEITNEVDLRISQ